jgi:phosphonatase-like hydrolase
MAESRESPRLVVLDMAGTTVEDRGQVPAAFEDALREAGIAVTKEQIARVRGASKRQAIRQLLPRLREDASATQAREQESRADVIYADFASRLKAGFADAVREIPGAAAVMADLRARGIKVALNTGFDRDITRLLIDTLGWQDAADTIVCGDDVANGRPAADMIRLAMGRTGVTDPLQVANVGDTTLDLEAAHRAGVRWNVGVCSGAHDRATLARAPHTHLVASIAELPL